MVTELTRRMHRWWSEPTPRYLLLPIAVMIALIAFGVQGARNAIYDQRIDAAVDEANQRDYVQCLSRVDTREALREVLLGITALFPDSEGADAIEELIQSEYPMLDIASCGVVPIPLPVPTAGSAP